MVSAGDLGLNIIPLVFFPPLLEIIISKYSPRVRLYSQGFPSSSQMLLRVCARKNTDLWRPKFESHSYLLVMWFWIS